MKKSLERHKTEMERVKAEMRKCGSPHRNDLYKYYQRLKKEYEEAMFYLKGTNYDNTSEN